MIVERRIDPARIFASVGRPLAGLLAYDVLVTVLYAAFGQHWLGVESLPLALLGSALAVILGIRNNIAYARWWEARTLWGSAVNNSRSFARGVLTMLPGEAEAGSVARLVHLQIAWAHALRLALHKRDPWDCLTGLLPDETLSRLRQAVNVPARVQMEIALVLGKAGGAGRLDSMKLAALDATLSALANAQGGLERIRSTPLPRQFDQFPRVFIALYCLLLPVGLVSDLGALTPIGSTVIGFAVYVLDQIGRDLEDPFAGGMHDVPMAAITRTIETDLRQMIGEAGQGALAPADGVLS